MSENGRVYDSDWLNTAHVLIPDIMYNGTFPINRVLTDLSLRARDTWSNNRSAYIRRVALAEIDDIILSSSQTARDAAAVAAPVATSPINPFESLMRMLDSLNGTNGISVEWLNSPVPVRATTEELRVGTSTVISITESMCSICQDRISVGELTLKLNNCGHTFHNSCIGPWLENHVTCPTCRADLRQPETGTTQ